MNTTDEQEIREAFELIAGANRRGVFQGKVMDQVFQKMEGGNAAIATYYAGDYLSMLDNQADDVDLRYVIPEEGANWFVDAMCVLKDAPHYENAMKWINFIASTDANLANMDYIWYASPNREALERYGPQRVALAVEWVREEFPLPARGRGEPMNQERLEELLRRLEPAVFFDRGLCAHYFTYMKGPQAHFVLFDSPRSIREKLGLANRLGVAAALLPQPEVEPHLEDIFGSGA